MNYMNNYVSISLNHNSLKTLGLAYKARKVISGELIYKNFKHIKLLFIASDASIKTKDRLLKKAHYYKIPVVDNFNCNQLSIAIGKKKRVAVALIDREFYQAIVKYREDSQ